MAHCIVTNGIYYDIVMQGDFLFSKTILEYTVHFFTMYFIFHKASILPETLGHLLYVLYNLRRSP